MVSAEGQKITERFFEVIEILKSTKVIRGQATLSRELGVENSSMYKLKNQPEIYTLKPEYIRHLCMKYGVSASWIITGGGKMFTK